MTRRIHSILPAMILLLGAQTVAAQICDSCGLQDRGDRVEGVVEREEIAGGSFELLSLHYRGGAADSGNRVHLYFWQSQGGELDELRVWQPARRYRMEPNNRNFPAGRGQFSWSKTDVLARLGLSVDSLYVRIKRGGTYIPALLTTGQAAISSGYVFVFRSGAGIDATCTILHQGSAESVHSFEHFVVHSGDVTIEWDGLDADRRPVPDGKYVLKIEGEMLTPTIVPLNKKVAFEHRGSLE